MADPLSVAASIAGLVQLAEIVFGRTYKYAKSVKSASTEIASLSSEIGALYGILSNLRLLADQLEGGVYESHLKSHQIHACFMTLDRVKSLLGDVSTTDSSKPDRLSLKDKLRWPLKSSETKNLIAEIERHKTTLGLALNATSMTGVLQALSTQNDIDQGVRDIKTELQRRREAETRIAIDEKRREILKSFGSLHPRNNHNMSRKLHHPGTGLWLTEGLEFKNWQSIDNAQLWLYGIPGAGKTVLASLIIDEVLAMTSPNKAAAYFYCDYKNSATQEPHKILGSLVQQLATQDEQSFAKVQEFHDRHMIGGPCSYDAKSLCELIRSIALDYECTMIVVDGLDECGANAHCVTELLSSLGNDHAGTDIKLVFLSRDEVEIRECLENWPKVSIAAESGDLKLYVGAEIENRTRRKELKVKSLDLKDLIAERLVEGADGMFRWVTCQLDYLCELPNDAARRKALNDLPRGLIPTYERILRQIQDKNLEAQVVVQRTLRWLTNGRRYGLFLSSEAFCEAISIHPGDETRDSEAIVDDSEVLRHCRSLIRLSVEGTYFEFAHFSVLEFLEGLRDRGDTEFRSFHIDSKQGPTELCKTCLTYLTFREFDQGGDGSLQITQDRFQHYPFREFAVRSWWIFAQDADWEDHGLFSQITGFLNPSKPSTLISWAQDYFVSLEGGLLFSYESSEFIIAMNRGISEATALHFAAMLDLPRACKWLIEAGYNVSQTSVLGTPLHFAILGTLVLRGQYRPLSRPVGFYCKNHEAIDVLLTAGADPNDKYHGIGDALSPLYLATTSEDRIAIKQLIEHGAIVDDNYWYLVTAHSWTERTPTDLLYILQHAKVVTLNEVAQAEAWQTALVTQDTPFNDLFPSHFANKGILEKQDSLRVAAEYGQLGAVSQLIEEFGVDVNSLLSSNPRTALHIACEKDHIDVAKFLINRGANPLRMDQEGRTALHHAGCNRNGRSFAYLLDCAFESTTRDNCGLTPWHCVIRCGNLVAIKLLQDHEEVRMALQRQEEVGSKNLSLMSCAAQTGSEEAISILLDLGFSSMELDQDGCTAIHHAARAGSPEVIQTLISQGVDVKAISLDGSSAIHYATNFQQSTLAKVVQILLDHGVNPFAPRNDGDSFLDIVLSYEERQGLPFGSEEVVEEVLDTLASAAESSKCKNEVFSLALHKSLEASRGLLIRCLKAVVKYEIDLSQKSADGDVTLLEAFLEAREMMAANRELMPDEEEFSKEPVRHRFRRPTAKPWGDSANYSAVDQELSHILEHVPYSGPLHEVCARPIYLLHFLEICEEVACKLLPHVANVDVCVEEEKISPIAPIEAACASACSQATILKFLERSSASSDGKIGSALVLQACRYGRYGTLLELLEAGLSPHGVSEEGQTALMLAAQVGNAEMVEKLISSGCKFDSKCDMDRTVIHYACRSGNVRVLRILQTMNLNWNAGSSYYIAGQLRQRVTVLHLASTYKDASVLRYLLDEDLCQDLDCVTDAQETPLYWGSWFGMPHNVSLLLSRGANPTIQANRDPRDPGLKVSSIHLAAELGSEHLIRIFLDNGCDMMATDSKGLTSELIALQQGHTKLASVIRNSAGEHERVGSGPESSTKYTPLKKRASTQLRLAIDLGDIELCDRLVREGVDLNRFYADHKGCTCTALRYSLCSRRPLIAEYLFLKGADPYGEGCESHGNVGLSVIHLAAWYGYFRVLEILLERHPQAYSLSTHPFHPLHFAIASKAEEAVYCVSLILVHGKKANVRAAKKVENLANLRAGILNETSNQWPNMSNETPLTLAATHSNCEMVQLLLKAGASINDYGQRQETPLHRSTRSCNEEMTKLLLNSGASISARDNKLRTPVMHAAAFGNVELLQLLSPSNAELQAQDDLGWDSITHAVNDGTKDILLHILATLKWPKLSQRSNGGFSVVEMAFDDRGAAICVALLNAGLSQEAFLPGKMNVLSMAISNPRMTHKIMKMLMKRIPENVLPSVLNHKSKVGGTPLYAASTMADPSIQAAVIEMLLKTGADMEADGGDCGTALMGACAMGRLVAVKILIRKGARLAYIGQDGRETSALHAAEPFPDLIRWLLVGRFMEGPELLTPV